MLRKLIFREMSYFGNEQRKRKIVIQMRPSFLGIKRTAIEHDLWIFMLKKFYLKEK